MTDNELNNANEITIKEVILFIQDWFNYLLKRWIFIVLFTLIGGIIGFFYANNQKIKYTARTTFVLEEGKGSSSGLGGLASLAGQFGFDVGGSSGGGLLSGDNILLYFKSPSLAREVLLSRLDSKTNKSIADYYADIYGFKKLWIDNKEIGNVKFPVYTSGIIYSRMQDSLLQVIISLVNSTQFSVSRTDKKAGFIDVTCTMKDELLAKIYCERIVQQVVERYINIKTQRQNATVQKLQLRLDSITNLLRQKTYSGASLQNSSNTMDINPLYKTNTNVAVETTLRDKTLLSTIFASITQNLEMAKFTLSQETPVIQIVDSPTLPLKKEKLSRTTSALSGSVISSLIVLIGLIFSRIYNNAFIKGN